MKKNKFFITLFGFIIVNNSMANSCVTIDKKENNYYTVNARINHATHIVLPEVMVGEPIMGNSQLWDAQLVAGNNLLIKPNSTLEQGKSTTVNTISENGNPYFFVVKRVKSSANYCVLVKNKTAFGNISSYNEDGSKDVYANANPSIKIKNKLKKLEEELQEYKDKESEKISSAIKRYENDIFSNYKFTHFGKPSSKLISIFDDGRITKFNFDDHRKGVPIIIGFLGNKEHLLQATVEENINLYSVVGIYDKFEIRFDEKNGYKVKRIDNEKW